MKTHYSGIDELSEHIVNCNLCSRLRNWCSEVARAKKPKHIDFAYWGKPVPGFGDVDARLLIIGLAPGAHGANRTGRVFTGDEAGVWLYDALYQFGFANRPNVLHKDDGLLLTDAYITNVVRCAPPGNKVTALETRQCLNSYLVREIELLRRVEVVLTLGQIAFNSYCSILKMQGGYAKDIKFYHGAVYSREKGLPSLVVSYHPSQQNTRTGKLSKEAWYDIFKNIQSILALRESGEF